LEDVVTAYKDGNMDAFTDAVYNFDQISKLDPWRTTILLKIKTEMQKSQGEGSDLT
jgi:alpha-soluble NSF attachment protein